MISQISRDQLWACAHSSVGQSRPFPSSGEATAPRSPTEEDSLKQRCQKTNRYNYIFAKRFYMFNTARSTKKTSVRPRRSNGVLPDSTGCFTSRTCPWGHGFRDPVWHRWGLLLASATCAHAQTGERVGDSLNAASALPRPFLDGKWSLGDSLR